MALILFGTTACHLCDDAQALLLSLPTPLTEDVYLEDIADSNELIERYGVRIPVLHHENSGAELDWPFDTERLLQFLQHCHCLPATPASIISA